MDPSALANMLRKIADEIERHNFVEWDDFEIEIRPGKSRAKVVREASSNRGPGIRSKEEVDGLLEQLMQAPTREIAFDVLEKLNFTRKELETLARPRSVHVMKDDTVQRIKEKLVEAIVGSRLNSRAIRGE